MRLYPRRSAVRPAQAPRRRSCKGLRRRRVPMALGENPSAPRWKAKATVVPRVWRKYKEVAARA